MPWPYRKSNHPCHVNIVICVSGRIQEALLRMVNQSLFVAFACFAALTLSIGLDLRARYVACNEKANQSTCTLTCQSDVPRKVVLTKVG